MNIKELLIRDISQMSEVQLYELIMLFSELPSAELRSRFGISPDIIFSCAKCGARSGCGREQNETACYDEFCRFCNL